jgi:hypothetical protein
VVVVSNICCSANRLVAELLGESGVRNEFSRASFSSLSSSNFDDTVVDVDKKQSCLATVAGVDTNNACTGEEANTISGNRNIRWVAATATIVPSAKLLPSSLLTDL